MYGASCEECEQGYCTDAALLGQTGLLRTPGTDLSLHQCCCSNLVPTFRKMS